MCNIPLPQPIPLSIISQATIPCVFEDIEAVIRMVSTGHSPKLRRVARTHRMNLDCFRESTRTPQFPFAMFVRVSYWLTCRLADHSRPLQQHRVVSLRRHSRTLLAPKRKFFSLSHTKKSEMAASQRKGTFGNVVTSATSQSAIHCWNPPNSAPWVMGLGMEQWCDRTTGRQYASCQSYGAGDGEGAGNEPTAPTVVEDSSQQEEWRCAVCCKGAGMSRGTPQAAVVCMIRNQKEPGETSRKDTRLESGSRSDPRHQIDLKPNMRVYPSEHRASSQSRESCGCL